ncbi:restriction endonuclease subunit S [Arthrobacter sp. ISL-72]|uniref:restriction endonuclease subunit S n=1 Tax=Arthrobacter sp. ISL-72 TaxID=2819114 RepID=UPI001BEB3C3F|nr:restriction endonuclease subunit S [Arthrobacter sp. ISL-72]MBT2596223.1 restriction endonuclease subunit S [Arthrobacter sp. ISL-72]
MNTTQLGDLADLRAGFGFPKMYQGRSLGELPFAKVGDISRVGRSGSNVLTTAGHYIDEVDLTALKARAVPAGSTLFAKIGEAIRQEHRVMAGCSVVIDNNAMAAVPKPGVDPGYLFRFLQTVNMYSMTASTTVPALRKSDLELIPAPRRDIVQQRRIVSILDKADELRTKRRQALAQLDVLAQSLFHNMFGNVSLNDRGWESDTKLADVAEISSGITKGRRTNGQDLTTVPYMAVSNVQDMSLKLETVKYIDATPEEIDRLKLRKDDLLLTEGGDPDKLGRGTLWAEQLPLSIHQNHVFRVRVVREHVIHPLFLNWIVGSSRGKSYFLKSAKQTTGIASINMTQLKAFPLLVPPFRLQEEFARRVAMIHRLRDRHSDQLAELDALFASLQHRAFSGQL